MGKCKKNENLKMRNMKHLKRSNTKALLIVVFVLLLGSCQNNNSSSNKESEKKDEFLVTIEELQKDGFKNYFEIEKLVNAKLEKDGAEYFIEKDCYEVLGKYESTLKTYCQICEKINIENKGGLITSYLHLNDTANVKNTFERMKDDQTSFMFKEYHKYKDSGKKLEGKYVTIRYDEREEDFANALYAHIEGMESFIETEYEGLLPPVIRVILMHHDGACPYNFNLNETYMAVKSMPLENSKEMAAAISHETFHMVNMNLLGQKCKFKIDWKMNSFKFLDEGYAQLIQSKFQNKYIENRKGVDEYSKNMVLEKKFDFEGLKTKWVELFSQQDVNIYSLAYSFAYFLDDKYGAEKHKALFLPTENVPEETWVAYVENHFGKSVDELMNEWKQKLIQQ